MNTKSIPIGKSGLSGVLVLLLGLLAGCVHALHPYNQPSTEKVRLDAKNITEYAILVADQTSDRISADGKVTLSIPRLPRGCTKYFLGIKVADSSCYDVPVIAITRNGRNIATLSLNQLHQLPFDESGYHIVKLNR